MDINTALKFIQEIPEGYIVWRVDNGEIVKVIPIKDEEKRFVNLPETINGRVIEYTCSPYKSDEITQSYLESARASYIEQHLRITMFTDWARQSAEQLIMILETGAYPSAGSRSDDAILIDYLFEFHWQELNQKLRDRLWQLLEMGKLASPTVTDLRLRLLTIEQKKDEFINLWIEKFYQKTSPSFLAMKCAGDLQIANKIVINDLIKIIKSNFVWGAKYNAMMALGRIGVVAGEQAAKAIEENIYRSNPEVEKQRELALRRIRTSPDSWIMCKACHNGLALYFTRYAQSATCETCYGFGVVWNGKIE